MGKEAGMGSADAKSGIGVCPMGRRDPFPVDRSHRPSYTHCPEKEDAHPSRDVQEP